MKAWSTDVEIWGTVYIKAETKEEAKAILDKKWGKGVFIEMPDEITDGDDSFLSAAMTVGPGAGDLEEAGDANEYFEVDDDTKDMA